jgi:hypothetical protein
MAIDLADWLRGLGVGQYEITFRENDIDAEVLPNLTELDFEKLGLSLGHRKRLLKAIANLESGPVALYRPSEASLQQSLMMPFDAPREVMNGDFTGPPLRAFARMVEEGFMAPLKRALADILPRQGLPPDGGWGRTEDWKPIATAPKDGRYIRVKREHFEETVAWSNPLEGWVLPIHPRDAERATLLAWDPMYWRSLSIPTRAPSSDQDQDLRHRRVGVRP